MTEIKTIDSKFGKKLTKETFIDSVILEHPPNKMIQEVNTMMSVLAFYADTHTDKEMLPDCIKTCTEVLAIFSDLGKFQRMPDKPSKEQVFMNKPQNTDAVDDKTIDFNPFNGKQIESLEISLRELQATIKEDPKKYFWLLEYQFWQMFQAEGMDIEIVKDSYVLFTKLQAVMLSAHCSHKKK
jgi:hypothetical protein